METSVNLMQKDCLGVPMLFWTLLLGLVVVGAVVTIAIKVPVVFNRSERGLTIKTNLPLKGEPTRKLAAKVPKKATKRTGRK